MDTGPKIAQVAALVGDPARANTLAALVDGRALTASELAYLPGVAPQTASGHLAKLNDAGLLALEKQGRRRYFRLASPLVASMLESIMVVAQDGPARQRNLWRGGDTLRHARTCYDQMAGRIAVAIADRLVQRSLIVLDEDGGQLTTAGRSFFEEIGIDFRPAPSVGCSAAPVSIGASVGRIRRAPSEPRSCAMRSSTIGSRASASPSSHSAHPASGPGWRRRR